MAQPTLSHLSCIIFTKLLYGFWQLTIEFCTEHLLWVLNALSKVALMFATLISSEDNTWNCVASGNESVATHFAFVLVSQANKSNLAMSASVSFHVLKKIYISIALSINQWKYLTSSCISDAFGNPISFPMATSLRFELMYERIAIFSDLSRTTICGSSQFVVEKL